MTIANTEVRPDLRSLLQPAPQAWTLEFPALDSLLPAAGEPACKGLRVCIATRDIVGPASAGGPQAHHSQLARQLAADGHRVSVLYLRDRDSEIGWIKNWTELYAAMGVEFVLVEDVAAAERREGRAGPADGPMYNMYRHLQQHAYDVIHAPEAGGPAYLALLAKAQGRQFRHSHFVIHAGGSLLAERLRIGAPLATPADLVRIDAEQKSIELADHLVAASTHDLRWMAAQGYALPQGRSFVQPAIPPATAQTPPGSGATPPHLPGDLVNIDHLVVLAEAGPFGGGEIFCEAIERLLQQGQTLPGRTTIHLCPGRPDLKAEAGRWENEAALRRIRAACQNWPGEVSLQDGPLPQDLIAGLAGRNALVAVLAVTPPPAAFEALEAGVPLLMRDDGGAADLLAGQFRAEVLFDAHPAGLAQALSRVLSKGGRVAEAAHSRNGIAEIWRAYHQMAHVPSDTGHDESGQGLQDWPGVEVILPLCDEPAALEITLSALEACSYPGLQVTLLAGGGDPDPDHGSLQRRLQRRGWQLLQTSGQDAAMAVHQAVAQSGAEFVYLTRPGNTLQPDALPALVAVAVKRGLAAVTAFTREGDGEDGLLHCPVLGNLALAALEPVGRPLDLLLNRAAFLSLGAGTDDDARQDSGIGICQSLQLNGYRVETLPEVLIRLPDPDPDRAAAADAPDTGLDGLRPVLRYGPLVLRNLLLAGHAAVQSRSGLEEDLQQARSARDRHKAEMMARLVERDAARARSLELEYLLARKENELADSAARLQKKEQQLTGQLEELAARLKERNGELKAMRDRAALRTAAASDQSETGGLSPPVVKEAEPAASAAQKAELAALRDKLKARNAELVVQREKLDDLRARFRSLEASQSGPSADELRRRLQARNDEVAGLRQKLRDLRATLAARDEAAPRAAGPEGEDVAQPGRGEE